MVQSPQIEVRISRLNKALCFLINPQEKVQRPLSMISKVQIETEYLFSFAEKQRCSQYF